jgi:hypothetical protein
MIDETKAKEFALGIEDPSVPDGEKFKMATALDEYFQAEDLKVDKSIKKSFTSPSIEGVKIDDNVMAGYGASPEEIATIKKGAANVAWLARREQKPIDHFNLTLPVYQDTYAQQYFKSPKKSVTDDEFYQLVSEDYKAQDNAHNLAFSAAARNLTAISAMNEFDVGLTGSPVAGRVKDYYDSIGNIHFEYTQRLAPYRTIIDQAAKTIEGYDTKAEGVSDTFAKVAESLLPLPPKERLLVINAIGEVGAAAPKEKQAYLQKLATAMDREVEKAVTGTASLAESMLTSQAISLYQNIPEMQGIVDVAKKRRELQVLAGQVKMMAHSKINPIAGNNWWEETGIGVARMTPLLAATFISSPASIAIMTGQFRDEATIEAVNAGVSFENAEVVGAISAPFMATQEFISNALPLGKIKIPFIDKWLKAATTSVKSAAIRVATRTVIGTATEISEEVMQTATPLLTQDLLSEWQSAWSIESGISKADWDERMPKISDIAEQTFGPALIVSFLMAGRISIADVKNSRALITSPDYMVKSGIAPDLANQITVEGLKGNYTEVDKLFRKGFDKGNKATPEQIKEAKRKINIRESAALEWHNKARQDFGLGTPANIGNGKYQFTTPILKDGKGNIIDQGVSAQFDSLSEANEAWMRYLKNSRITIRKAEQEFLTSMVNTLEEKQGLDVALMMDYDMFTKQFTELFPSTTAQVEERIKLTGQIDGAVEDVSLENATLESEANDNKNYRILGTNSIEQREGISVGVITLYKGGSLLDLIEESAEVGVKRLMSDPTSRTRLILQIRDVEAKMKDQAMQMGQKHMPLIATTDDDKVSNMEIIEAFSHIAKSYYVQTTKAVERPTFTPNMPLNLYLGSLQSSIAGMELKDAIDLVGEKTLNILYRASQLKAIHDANGLNQDFVAALEKSVGLNVSNRNADGVVDTAAGIAADAGVTMSMVRVTPAQDAEHLASAKAGDMAKAQAMVDEAAKKAGLIEGFRAENAGRGVKTDAIQGGIYFFPKRETAELWAGKQGTVVHKFLEPRKLEISREPEGSMNRGNADTLIRKYADDPEDGTAEIVVFSKDQIKSADPVTYDADGNVIPLSQRFNQASPDINFSMAQEVTLEQVQASVKPVVIVDEALWTSVDQGASFPTRKRAQNDIMIKTPAGDEASRMSPPRVNIYDPVATVTGKAKGENLKAYSLPPGLAGISDSESLIAKLNEQMNLMHTWAASSPQLASASLRFYSGMADAGYDLATGDIDAADLYLRWFAFLSPRASVISNAAKAIGGGASAFASEFTPGFKAGTVNQVLGMSTIVDEWRNGEAFAMHLTGVDNKVRNFYLNGAAELLHKAIRLDLNPDSILNLAKKLATSLSVSVKTAGGVEVKVETMDDIELLKRELDRLVTSDMWDQAALGNVRAGFVIGEVLDNKKTNYIWVDPRPEAGRSVSIDSPEGLQVLDWHNRYGENKKNVSSWSDLSPQELETLDFDPESQTIRIYSPNEDGAMLLAAGGEGPTYDISQALSGMMADIINASGGMAGKSVWTAYNVQEYRWGMEKVKNPRKSMRDFSSYDEVVNALKDLSIAFEDGTVESAATKQLNKALNEFKTELNGEKDSKKQAAINAKIRSTETLLEQLQEFGVDASKGRDVVKDLISNVEGKDMSKALGSVSAAELAYATQARQLMPFEMQSEEGGKLYKTVFDEVLKKLALRGETDPVRTLLERVTGPGFLDGMQKTLNESRLPINLRSVRIGTGSYRATMSPNVVFEMSGPRWATSMFNIALAEALEQTGGNVIRNPSITEKLGGKKLTPVLEIVLPEGYTDNQILQVMTELGQLQDSQGRMSDGFIGGHTVLTDNEGASVISIHGGFYDGNFAVELDSVLDKVEKITDTVFGPTKIKISKKVVESYENNPQKSYQSESGRRGDRKDESTVEGRGQASSANSFRLDTVARLRSYVLSRVTGSLGRNAKPSQGVEKADPISRMTDLIGRSWEAMSLKREGKAFKVPEDVRILTGETDIKAAVLPALSALAVSEGLDNQNVKGVSILLWDIAQRVARSAIGKVVIKPQVSRADLNEINQKIINDQANFIASKDRLGFKVFGEGSFKAPKGFGLVEHQGERLLINIKKAKSTWKTGDWDNNIIRDLATVNPKIKTGIEVAGLNKDAYGYAFTYDPKGAPISSEAIDEATGQRMLGSTTEVDEETSSTSPTFSISRSDFTGRIEQSLRPLFEGSPDAKLKIGMMALKRAQAISGEALYNVGRPGAAKRKLAEMEASRIAKLGKVTDKTPDWVKKSLEKETTPEQAKAAMLKDKLNGWIQLHDAIVSSMPTEIRGTIGSISTLVKLSSDEARLKFIEERIPKMEKAVERYLKKEYGERIDKMLESAAVKGKAGEIPKSKFIVTVQDELNTIIDMASLSADDTVKEAARYEAEIISAQTAEDAADSFAKSQLLEVFGDLYGKQTTAEEMDVAHEYLKDLMTQGRNARKIIDEARAAEIAKMVEQAKADAFAGAANAATVQAGKDKGKGTTKGMMKGLLRELGSHRFVLSSIFGRSNKTADVFDERMILGVNAFETTQAARKKSLRDFMRALYGTKSKIKLDKELEKLETKVERSRVTYLSGEIRESDTKTVEEVAKIIKSPSTFGYSAEEAKLWEDEMDAWSNLPNARKRNLTIDRIKTLGTRIEIPLSQMEAVYMAMALRQPGILDQQSVHGYDHVTQTELEAFMSDDAKNWLAWFGAEYSAEYDTANEVFMKLFHTRMPQIQFYAPLLKNHQGNQASLDPLNSGVVSQSVNPGAVKSRRGRTSSLRIESALAVYQAHFVQMDYWVHMAEYLRDTQAVMLNADVQNAIKSGHGAEAMQTLSSWIQLEMSRGVGKGALVMHSSKLMRNLKSGVAMKALAFNIGTSIKTLSSVFYSLGEIPITRWPAAFTRGVEHWGKMWDTNIIQNRLELGGTPEIRHILANAGKSKNAILRLVENALVYGSVPTQYADAVLTSYSAAMVYGDRFAQAKDAGAGDDAAHKYAAREMEIAVSRTAQPNDWSGRSLIENDASGVFNLLSMFSSDPRQKLGLVGEAVMKWKRGGATNEETMRKVLAYWVIPGLMFQVANAVTRSLFKDDDKEWELDNFIRAAIVGPLQGLFLLGAAAEFFIASAVAAATEQLTGEKQDAPRNWRSSTNPMVDMSDQLLQSIKKLPENMENEDYLGGAWQIMKAGGAMVTPFSPAGSAPGIADRVFKDTSTLFYGKED